MVRWRNALLRRAQVLVVLCGAGLVLPLPMRWLGAAEGRVVWLLDLAVHWQWLYLAGFVFALALAALADRRWLLALPLAALPALSAAPRAPMASAAAPVLSIAVANVHVGNPQTEPLFAWLAATRPDVVVVLETSTALAPALAALADYPHQQVIARDDPFGIALLSRHPLVAHGEPSDDDGIPRIEAELQWQGQCVEIVAWHPMPPIAAAFHHARNEALRTLAAADAPRPRIIAGDLNATPWSSAFAGLAARGWRRASGLAPTWPSAGLGIIGIPIDQVLVSRQWSIVASERGPAIGSDHYPQLVQLQLSGPPAAGAGCRAAPPRGDVR